MRDWTLLAGIAVGGALGAVARYGITQLANVSWGTDFPFGTLLANVTGCFLLGTLGWASLLGQGFSPLWQATVSVGFLGALTTFSTFGFETIERWQGGSRGLAVANVSANLVAGLLAVWLGLSLARWLWSGAA